MYICTTEVYNMSFENSNAANRGANSQNVGAPVDDNPDMEDHIDDREESDHKEDTTSRTRPNNGESDEEGKEVEISPWDLRDAPKHTLEHRLRNSILIISLSLRRDD